MNKSIGIIEYGVGNLKSLEYTFRHINNQVVRVKEDDDFDKRLFMLLVQVHLVAVGEAIIQIKPQIYNWVNQNHFQVYVLVCKYIDL